MGHLQKGKIASTCLSVHVTSTTCTLHVQIGLLNIGNTRWGNQFKLPHLWRVSSTIHRLALVIFTASKLSVLVPILSDLTRLRPLLILAMQIVSSMTLLHFFSYRVAIDVDDDIGSPLTHPTIIVTASKHPA